VVDLNVGLLFFLAMSSIGAYSVVLGGWASNSKYSLLGALRSAAQMITYEVFLGLSLLGVVAMAGTFNLREIVEAQQNTWFIVPQFLGFFVFFLAGLAETHRLPFDLPEAEAELVAGFHAEYSGMKFGMFFVGEYMGIVLVSVMTTVLFFGGWLGPAWLPGRSGSRSRPSPSSPLHPAAGLLPRPRFDQLIAYGWKLLLPLALLNLIVTGGIVLWRAGS
jgi:NADH-quinone oxidoreductase subunit H